MGFVRACAGKNEPKQKVILQTRQKVNDWGSSFGRALPHAWQADFLFYTQKVRGSSPPGPVQGIRTPSVSQAKGQFEGFWFCLSYSTA